MSASDHLSENQFRLFHGTNQKIKGGFINPTKQHGDEWDGHGPEQAFASSHLLDAASYGGRVYEVKPTGDEENHGYGVFGSHEGFAVKREIPEKVVDRYTRIVGPIVKAKEEKASQEFAAKMATKKTHPVTGASIYSDHPDYDKITPALGKKYTKMAVDAFNRDGSEGMQKVRKKIEKEWNAMGGRSY